MKFPSKLAERSSDIYKICLFIFFIILIVIQFPREGKFKYEFKKGKPWMHADLIAPFDFAIFKTEEEITLEKNSMLPYKQHFFSYDSTVYNENLKIFTTEFDLKWGKKYKDTNKIKKNQHYNFSKAILDTIYSHGIIQLTDSIENKKGDLIINVIKGNVAEERKLETFFTIKTSDQYINSRLKNSKLDNELLVILLKNAISQNIFYNEDLTSKYKESILNEISLTRGMVQKGERVISKGEVVTTEKYQVIESLKKEFESQLGSSAKYYKILFGQFILIVISMSVLFVFLKSFRIEVFQNNNKVFFILCNIFLMVFVTATVIKIDSDFIYLIPFCILPVIIRAFFDTRLALFIHIITIVTIGFLVPNSFEFIFLQLITGIIAIISVIDLRKRAQFFLTSLLLFISYSMIYIGTTLMQDGSLLNINTTTFFWFAGSSLLVSFSYPLIFLYERIFGLITDISLIELSDVNSKLLRELSLKAPATLQHSIQVSTLAEEAIYAINGNTLLVRAGSLYHDIGKMDMPVYFTENQGMGINPHDELTSEESAAIIISHVTKGVELAKKHKLPEKVIDFIRSHHGTRRTAFFYSKFIKNNPGEPVDESKFKYFGPIPYSKETAVVMMADAVEAVSRTLKTPSEESINEMVENIINSQIEQQQFVNSDITFKDITVIKKIFKKKLQNMYHVRIEYPA